jgi:hypothetical protein
MVPPVVPEECRSPGEKEVFARLRDDPTTKTWFVLHSLDLAKHRSQVSGEIDFVVIVPLKGVLCLEVKACHELRRSAGLWYYGLADAKGDPRGPFKQASEGMHTLREHAAKRIPVLARAVFWSGVVFPYVPFETSSEEWHSWQVIDARSFRSRSFGELVTQMLDNARTYFDDGATAEWFDPELPVPDETQCEALVHLLRPEFEVFQSPRVRLKELDEEVLRYTAEQFGALDVMEANPRVLFEGPAGTGKTLLATEAARRAVSRTRRPLMLCYNRLLGRRLSDETKGLQPALTIATIHRHMLNVAQLAPPSSPTESFWQHDLPAQATETLLREGADEHVFDELIVDEAQDVIRGEFLDFLDLSLKGGLGAGTWRFFADFEKQAIYGTDRDALEDLLRRRSHGARYSLRINCRNSPRIAEWAQMLGGLDPHYKGILRPDDGVDPKIVYYGDSPQQGDRLRECVASLLDDGFTTRDIVILSPRAEGSCAQSQVGTATKIRLRPFGQVGGAGGIEYSTIHAFKGLESRAVVITDVEGIGDAAEQALFYTGITRALHRLVIIAHERVREQIRLIVRTQLQTH